MLMGSIKSKRQKGKQLNKDITILRVASNRTKISSAEFVGGNV
jgi:hypothetical protein